MSESTTWCGADNTEVTVSECGFRQGKKFQKTAGRSMFLSRLIYRWRRKYGLMQPETAKELKTFKKKTLA